MATCVMLRVHVMHVNGSWINIIYVSPNYIYIKCVCATCTKYRFSCVFSNKHTRAQFGQTPAHRAAILGCVMSISTIIQFVEDAIFKVKDNTGHTAIDLAEFLGNRECQQIANGKKPPKPLPRTPPTHRGTLDIQPHKIA